VHSPGGVWQVVTAEGDKPVRELVKDDAWLDGEFISTVQQRGAAIIKQRNLSVRPLGRLLRLRPHPQLGARHTRGTPLHPPQARILSGAPECRNSFSERPYHPPAFMLACCPPVSFM